MKTKLLLFLSFLTHSIFAQNNVTLTKIIETNCSSPYLKAVELYVDGTVDFSNGDVVINFMQNGGDWGSPAIDISSLGVVSDSFVYILKDNDLMQAEFPSVTFDSTNSVVLSTATNGDDGYQVVYMGAVVSQFGRTGTDADNDTESDWNHNDTVAVRLSNPDLGTWNPSDWEILDENTTDDYTLCKGGIGLEAYFEDLGGNYPLGSGSGWTPSDDVCTVILGSYSMSCNSTATGLTDDTYSASIDFTGGNNGNTFLITTTAGTISGENPSDIESGTIVIDGVDEGTDIMVEVSGGTCDLSISIESPACLPLAINEVHYDPANDLPGDANGDGNRDYAEDEFIEFYNSSSESLDISGFTISDSDQLRHTFPASSIIPPNKMLVVFGGGTPTGNFGGSVVQTASETELNLSNAGDVITVLNTVGDVVLSYNSTVTGINHGSNQSVTRSPDFSGSFVLHTTANSDLLYSPGLLSDGTSLSINQFENNLFSFFPNPVNNGFVNIKTQINGLVNVKLYDIMGRCILSKQINSEILDVRAIGSGVYLLQVSVADRSSTTKLIIR